MYACVVITLLQSTNQPGELANPVHGQLNRETFPCPHSRMRILFRETDLAVPSRVSLLILHTQAESGAYSRDCSPCPRRRLYIFATTHHRVSPGFIRSRNCVPIALTAESPLVQGQYSSQGSSSNGCRLCITMDQLLLCASFFPYPLVYRYNVSMFKYKILVLLLLYCFMGTFPPSDLCLYKN